MQAWDGAHVAFEGDQQWPPSRKRTARRESTHCSGSRSRLAPPPCCRGHRLIRLSSLPGTLHPGWSVDGSALSLYRWRVGTARRVGLGETHGRLAGGLKRDRDRRIAKRAPASSAPTPSPRSEILRS